MSQKKKSSKVTSFRRRPKFNIGIMMFGVIFVYMIVTILIYVTNDHISVYEVREGTIIKDNTFKGLAIRDEQVIEAPADGYINYFVSDATKVGAASEIYTLTSDKLQLSQEESSSEEITESTQSALLAKVQKFNENYSTDSFSDVYTLQDDFEQFISSSSNGSMKKQLKALTASDTNLNLYHPDADGLFLMYTDNYEAVSIDTLTKKNLAMSDYQKTSFTNNSKVKSGEPIYKLVTSEDWSLAFELSESVRKELKDTKSIQVKFLKDNETLWANIETKKIGDSYVGILSFETSMVRYSDERFLDIELELNNESGLKIPKSAVVEKDFYAIPSDYITQSGDLDGVMIKKSNGDTSFQSVDIAFSEDNKQYIETEELESGDVLQMPSSQDTMTVGTPKTIKGVYNINKGYSVFNRIVVKNSSSEYYIVSTNTSSGLSEYDHIALDGDTLSEGQVVIQ